ncbi:MAG TPA: methyltransferase domain-containing protein [Chthoniobacteraceae bacterium]|jgi:ubiquinone/menaquinone biosynthesis C-methylase UbiE|nr:methyltransferase domain-containing protein [Chthoniobacteraceae bacterium]
MRRSFDEGKPELLDIAQPVNPNLEASLQSLRVLNQYFGAYSLVRHFMRRWLERGRTYRLLDLATGFGDIPRMIVCWARRHGISVRVDAVDLQPATLEIARRASAGFPEIHYFRADARNYCEAMTYDVVCCSLALHHFSDMDAMKVLRRACELSHDKVLVADLERNWFTWACVQAVTAVATRDPMTRHDAKLSVKRAFSYQELGDLAHEAGWRNFGHARFVPARQAIWMCSHHEAPTMDLGTALDFAT